MATGYTCYVADGETTTLKDFAILCARAFGACIDMRDDPLSKQIPERFEPNIDYDLDCIKDAKEEILRLKLLDPSAYDSEAQIEYDSAYKSYVEYEEQKRLENSRYIAMLDEVRKWNPPEDIANLKTFMIDQLNISITNYSSPPPTKRNGEQWYKDSIEYHIGNIKYHTQHMQVVIKQTEEKNKWLATLRRSLEDMPNVA